MGDGPWGTTQGPCVGGSEPEAGLQQVFILKPGLAGTRRARRASRLWSFSPWMPGSQPRPACPQTERPPAAKAGHETRAPRDRTRGAGPRAQLCSWRGPEGRSRGLGGAGQGRSRELRNVFPALRAPSEGAWPAKAGPAQEFGISTAG